MIPHDQHGSAPSSEDAASSEAYQVLDTLLEIGQISAERCAGAKAQFERLHAAVAAALAQQTALVQQEQQLTQEAEASAAAAQEAQRKAAAFEGVSIEVLHDDVEAARAEASLAQERAALLVLEHEELGRQRDQLAAYLDTVAEQHAAALAPVVAGLQADVAALTGELDQQRLAASVAEQELAGAAARLQESRAALAALQQEHKVESNRLLTVSAAPEKALRQADLAAAELAAQQQQLAAADGKQVEVQAVLKAALEKERDRQREYAGALAALERGRITVEAKERHVDDVARDVELAGLEREKILAEQVDIDLQIQAMASELRSANELLAHARHDKAAALRAYKAAADALAEAQEALPQLKVARDLTAKDKAAAEAELSSTSAQIEAVKLAVDVRIAAFLKEEAVGTDKAVIVNAMRQEVALLEGEFAAVRDEDRQRSRLLQSMAAQRDRVACQVASLRSKLVAAQSAVKARSRQELELKLVAADVARRAREFQQLHDLVANQRNRFVALISAAGQAGVEMGDRLKLLGSEADILKAQVDNKAQAVLKAKGGSTAAVKARDQLCSELHGLGATLRAKRDKLQEQMEAVQGVQHQISRAEGAMALARKHYEAAVSSRNNTGVMLIDRNDELAALHEKAHVQEAQIHAGTQELAQREDEMRVLRLQVAELERSLHNARVAMPDVPAIDVEIAALKADLLQARREAAELGDRLEDPACSGRARQLGGRMPGKDELVAKLQSLEERLGMGQAALLERTVVLDEVAALTESLRGSAACGRAAGAALAAEANGYASRLRAVTRRMMATISELSLYQATALKLHASKAELEELLAAARARLAAGLAPTEEAEREWAALVRQADTLAELKQQRDEVAAILDARGAGVASTAPPRPNAYIPSDLGIPRPFGGAAPFKPSAPGATMRHMRRPAPREVVL